jgi:nucleotide-binding universal stress UspA family protein
MTGTKSKPAPLNVLVPLDGSELAERALPLATALARRTRGTVHLLAAHVPEPACVVPAAPVAMPEFAREAREHLARYLVATAGGLAASSDVQVTWALRDGHPAVEVDRYTREHAIDLVVMTTHGRSGLSRFWLGSVADQALRRVRIPVLLLRAGQAPTVAATPEFTRIVVALDGSDAAEAALEPAIVLGSLSPGASFTLALVVELAAPIVLATGQPTPIPTDWQEWQRRAGQVYLNRLARRLHRRGLEVETTVVEGAGVASRLVTLARELDASLLVLATRASDGLDRLLLGSVADKVVRTAAQPVLVVPPRVARRPDVATPSRLPRRRRAPARKD